MAWVRQARREGASRAEPVVNPRKSRTGSNLVDMGRAAVHACLRTGQRDSDAGELAGQEATPKDCGVGVARLPGKSWAPPPSTGTWETWEPFLGCPSRHAASMVAGRSAVDRGPWEGTEPP
jgi:hypothetical protein